MGWRGCVDDHVSFHPYLGNWKSRVFIRKAKREVKFNLKHGPRLLNRPEKEKIT